MVMQSAIVNYVFTMKFIDKNWKFSDRIVFNWRNKQDIPKMPLLNLAADDLLHSKTTGP